ncbi:MAG TPA: dipeptide/oligopeptide/nickel ABC transporter ATP-binding protein [Methanothrix sp.]|nr:dipeptide/oligopeptide/nickel ABC transporter ATP-binding protein [Methanothrix sp.]
MRSTLIDVQSLSKQYGRQKVIDEVSFSVEEGETLGLFGISGSGKTTIGRCIMLLEKPDCGKILFKGRDLLKMNRREVFGVRPRLQMIFQHPETSLNPKMRVKESIAEPLLIHRRLGRSEIDEELKQLIRQVGLRPEHLERYPQQISGGEIQRAVLARIMSLEPKFVVADEPTSMLDASVQAQILRLMMGLQEDTGLAYLFISHDLDVLRAVSDRIAFIEEGSISLIERNECKKKWGRSKRG